MTRHGRKQSPPIRPPVRPSSTPGILELDRFSGADLDRWRRLSADLDEYTDILYFGVEPQRQRHKEELRRALAEVPPSPLVIRDWVCLVAWRYALDPLSAAGSLTTIGGRFNPGIDVDKAMVDPWPALYLAGGLETAFRERFQLPRGENVDGLAPEELALQRVDSFASVFLNGHIERVFDLAAPHALDALCAVLKRMKLPNEVKAIERRLKLPGGQHAYMVRTPQRLLDEVLQKNWRTAPVQFGLPSVSQIFAGMVRDAGFEAIRYPSTKGNGQCLALFPDRLVSERTELRLRDDAPTGIRQRELTMDTADALCSWELLRSRQRPGS